MSRGVLRSRSHWPSALTRAVPHCDYLPHRLLSLVCFYSPHLSTMLSLPAVSPYVLPLPRRLSASSLSDHRFSHSGTFLLRRGASTRALLLLLAMLSGCLANWHVLLPQLDPYTLAHLWVSSHRSSYGGHHILPFFTRSPASLFSSVVT